MTDDQEKLTQSIIDIVKAVTMCNEVNSSSSTENLSQWDSMAYMAIISEVELNYGVEITQNNIQKFDSIQILFSLYIHQ